MIQHNTEHMSISQMIQNPTGKHSAFFASRARVKAQLDVIFIKNLRKFRREFYAVPYVDDKTHDIVYYVSIPSETFYLNKIRWDCVIEIKYDSSKSLENRDAKFYTNSPSFIYTYAYVFNQQGLIPDFIKVKMPPECLTVRPEVRNPIEARGFDKILYQALKYLTVGGCLTDAYIDKYKQRWNLLTQSEIQARCADTGTLVAVYQHAKKLDALKRNTNRKKVTTKERNDMQAEAKHYEQFKKANTPSYVGTIIRRAPRSKITARKATKSMYAKVKKPIRSTIRKY